MEAAGLSTNALGRGRAQWASPALQAPETRCLGGSLTQRARQHSTRFGWWLRSDLTLPGLLRTWTILRAQARLSP